MRSFGSKPILSFATLALLVGALTVPVAPALAREDSFVRIEKPAAAREGDSVGFVIRATGEGLQPPGQAATQARLMARRAAIVDGYRKLATMRGKVVSSITGKDYYESASAFIKGAEVIETRYYYDGRVEVDMELPVTVGGAPTRDMSPESLGQTLRESGVAVVEVEPERRRITKEEWKQLFMKRQTNEEKP